MARAANLKVIGRAGIGVDNIDVAAATRNGVVVMNAPGGNTVTTGEHAISLLLALARNIPQGTATLKEGRWEKKALMGVELTGKTLGVVGLGHIGRVVASLANGLRMKVIAADPFVSAEAAEALDVELVTNEELYARADFITLHVPRLKETVNMINADTLSGWSIAPGEKLSNWMTYTMRWKVAMWPGPRWMCCPWSRRIRLWLYYSIPGWFLHRI